MAKRPPTKLGTRKLSEVAKKIVKPDGIVSSGYPAVRDTCRKMGIVHDGWQVGLGRLVLAKRESGLYAAGIGGIIISICRQVGKTFTIASIIFALCILFPGMKVLWTAHRTRTSDETFMWMKGFTKRRKIAPYIDVVRSANGQQEVLFRNGSRIMFGARENGFGLGFDDVDAVIYDEAQRLTEKALDDMVPTTNAAQNPLVIYLGTPPRPTDKGEVFSARRKKAYAGTLKNAVYVEIGADPDAALDDRTQWAKANPSYPHRTREDAILRLRENLTDDSFRREALGIWDIDRGVESEISFVEWEGRSVGAPPDSPLKCIAIAFDVDGMHMSIAGAVRAGDRVHGELIDIYDGPVDGGLAAIADWLVEADEHGVPRWKRTAGIVLAGQSGAPTLAQYLRERKVPSMWIIQMTRGEYFAACQEMRDLVTAKNFTRLDEGQEALDDSVLCSKKEIRNQTGAWGWKATGDGDETPIEAVSCAAWGTRHSKLVGRYARAHKKRRVVRK